MVLYDVSERERAADVEDHEPDTGNRRKGARAARCFSGGVETISGKIARIHARAHLNGPHFDTEVEGDKCVVI